MKSDGEELSSVTLGESAGLLLCPLPPWLPSMPWDATTPAPERTQPFREAVM